VTDRCDECPCMTLADSFPKDLYNRTALQSSVTSLAHPGTLLPGPSIDVVYDVRYNREGANPLRTEWGA